MTGAAERSLLDGLLLHPEHVAAASEIVVDEDFVEPFHRAVWRALVDLPREERQEVVASLRDAGLSIRAIAAATGDSYSTVQRDLSPGDPNESPDDDPAPAPTPKPVTGTDGKSYPNKATTGPTGKHRTDRAAVAVAERSYAAVARRLAEMSDRPVHRCAADLFGLGLLSDDEVVDTSDPLGAAVVVAEQGRRRRIAAELAEAARNVAGGADPDRVLADLGASA